MNADVNMEYCMESKNDGRKIYQEKGNGEPFSSGETDAKKKRYNRVCLQRLPWVQLLFCCGAYSPPRQILEKMQWEHTARQKFPAQTLAYEFWNIINQIMG